MDVLTDILNLAGAYGIAKTTIQGGKRVAAAVKKAVPVASSAVQYKSAKFKQAFQRKTDPVVRAVVEKVVRPARDRVESPINSPIRTAIQDDKKDKLKVTYNFNKAARDPILRPLKTVAGPQKGVMFKGMPQPRSPETKPAIGDKRAQAQQLIARRADPKTKSPAPAPAKRPPKTK